MTRLAATMLICLATSAAAEAVKVSSGEHADFSRLVLAVPTDGDWRLGRTATGYALDIGQDNPRYDLSTVFDLIPRDRLAGIFADPETGHLQLTLRCTCHAIPFSLDARTLVIDLRDGPPPENSSFEVSLDGVALPPLQSRQAARPRARQSPSAAADDAEYAWLSIPDLRLPVLPVEPPVLPDGVADGLKEALVGQLAEGAARGVVDLALPPAASAGSAMAALPPGAPLRLAAAPGMQVAAGRGRPTMMQPDGEICIADDRLDLAAWGATADVAGQLGAARMALVGEFDIPQSDAVAAQARLYLFLGFGAETGALLAAMAPADDDRAIWQAMAGLIDGDPVAGTPFDGMLGCDSAAAFWALLAAPVDGGGKPNTAAVQRAFSALPPHLRRLIGPRVAERLLARGQPGAAQGIIDAMGRGAIAPDPETLLVAAELDMTKGAPDAALAKAEMALAAGGPSAPAAMIAQVRAQIAAGEPIDPAVAEALAAFRADHEGDAIAADLAEAHQLALIGSGQFAAAFSTDAGALPAAFWTAIAAHGSDDELLQFGFVPPAKDGAAIPAATMSRMAERLQALGFHDAAAGWAALGGTMPATADASGAAGDENPPRLADSGPWQELTAQMSGPPRSDEPPLAEATRLMEDSRATREMIDALIGATPPTGG